MHTVILGNGILALTIAFRLSRRGTATDQITIVGKAGRPGSATLAAAAMLNSFAEVEAGGLDSELDLVGHAVGLLPKRLRNQRGVIQCEISLRIRG